MPELSLVTTFVGLLTITNPIGNLPIFLTLTADQGERRRRQTAMFVAFAVFVVLVVALLAGEPVLELFDIDLHAFRVAGALVIAALGWAMLTARRSPVLGRRDEAQSVTIVPLAIPVLAGPGAISLVITYGVRADSFREYALEVAIIGLVALAVAAVLVVGPVVARILGSTGMDVLTRIFGLLILAIAIGAIFDVLKEEFPGLVR